MDGERRKVAVIAGVGGGLGSAIARELLGKGFDTVGIARSSAALDRLRAVATRHGWTFDGVVADLGRPDAAARAVATIERDHGGIDSVVVPAGHWVEGETLLHRLTDEAWTVGLADNLNPTFFVLRAALPGMIARRSGAVVLVAASERVRHAGTASYCVAKGGLVDLGAKLARDYRADGIRVNVLLPGTMEHELDPDRPPSVADPLPLRDASGQGAWEVARAAAFLLSDEARWITGGALTVDGGHATHGREPPAPTPAR